MSIKSIIFQPHHSETIKYIDIDKYVDIDIYTEITWTFFLAMAQNEYTQRENWGSLIHFENFHLFGEHDWKIRKAFPQLDGKLRKGIRTIAPRGKLPPG